MQQRDYNNNTKSSVKNIKFNTYYYIAKFLLPVIIYM